MVEVLKKIDVVVVDTWVVVPQQRRQHLGQSTALADVVQGCSSARANVPVLHNGVHDVQHALHTIVVVPIYSSALSPGYHNVCVYECMYVAMNCVLYVCICMYACKYF